MSDTQNTPASPSIDFNTLSTITDISAYIETLDTLKKTDGENFSKLKPELFGFLSQRLQNIFLQNPGKKTDEDKMKLLSLLQTLKILEQVLLKGEVKNTMIFVKESVRDILTNYEFIKFSAFHQLETYVDSANHEGAWNSIKLKSFLKVFARFSKHTDDVALKTLLAKLFDIPEVKGCSWSEDMIEQFVNDIVGKIHDPDIKRRIKELFLSLPKIKKIPEIERVGKNWKILEIKKQPGSGWYGSNLGGLSAKGILRAVAK